jgi:hypothetical protein
LRKAKSIVSLAAVAAVVGALSMTIYAWSAVSCEIRNQMGTSLNAIIFGSGPVSGTYVFNVSSDSS